MAAPPVVNGVHSGRESGGMTGLSNGSSFDVLTPPSTNSSPAPHSLTDITLEQALARAQELARENAELRDFMRENNAKMQQQYDALTKWKEKVHEANVVNKEKFEQTRALITALRKENEELQKQSAEMQEENKQLKNQLQQLEEANAGLQRMTIASSHVIQDLREQATEQGLSVGSPEDISAFQENMVHVASADKEQEIEELENKVEQLTEEMRRTRERQQELEEENHRFRESTDQLLMDLESTQRLMKDQQKENQKLTQENLDLRQEVQAILSDTKTSFHMEREAASRLLGMESGAASLGKPQQEEGQEGQVSARAEREVARLEREVSDAKEELQAAHHECQQLQEKVQRLEQTSEKLTQQMQAAQRTHREELSRLNQQHEEKLTAMTRQHETPKQMPSEDAYTHDIHSLRSQVLTLLSEVNELTTKLSKATSLCDSKDFRLREMEQRENQIHQELQLARQLTAKLQKAVGNAQAAAECERKEHAETKKQMNDLRESFNQLVSDYKELLDMFDQCKEQERSQASRSDELSQLTAQVMAAEEALAVRNEQISRLREQLSLSKKDYENNIAVLQAQADIFRADFDAERQAREKQVEEKDRILSEMNNLQIRNQQLVDEVEGYSRRELSEMQQRYSNLNMGLGSPMVYPHHPQPNYAQPPRPAYPAPPARQEQQSAFTRVNQPSQHEEVCEMECPKCFRQFPDLDTLQLHVIDCMDEVV